MTNLHNGLQKVLVFDIETSPCLGWFWQTGKARITADQILDHTKIIMISYMFVGDKETQCLVWDKNQNDKSMLEKFAKVAAKADAVIGHNSDNFDIKTLNARVAYHGIKPIVWGSAKDTFKMIKKKFRLPSLTLKYLLRYFNLSSKLKTESGLWVKVWWDKDKKALQDMIEYCKQDTRGLEELVRRLQPYLEPIVNHSLRSEKMCCPKCGSEDYQKYGFRFTNLGKYQRYLCNSCGSDFRSATNLISKANR